MSVCVCARVRAFCVWFLPVVCPVCVCVCSVRMRVCMCTCVRAPANVSFPLWILNFSCTLFGLDIFTYPNQSAYI